MLQLAWWLVEIYVNNFVGVVQSPSRALLRHITRAILMPIHEVFVPPHRSCHKVGDSVAIKNLINGEGSWSTKKGVLGWNLNGITLCISLPTHKVKNLRKAIKEALQIKSLSLKKFQKLVGHL